MNKTTSLPPIVSPAEWQVAHEALLVEAPTRARDALAALRRRQPVLRIDEDYDLEGLNGKANLLELFAGRRQFILYHFMFGPGAHGWPHAGCEGCSMLVDQVGHLVHLNARDTSFALVSIAPIADIVLYRKRMGWTIPGFSSAGTEFNRDFGVTTEAGAMFGLSVFLRDGRDIYRTYFTSGRGVEAVGSVWTFLDLTPFGWQEEWEVPPKGWPQSTPYVWCAATMTTRLCYNSGSCWRWAHGAL
jgi:predicted dithiol-disulfide oxidoreductase (DUF899 family)